MICRGIFDIAAKEKALESCEEEMAQGGFWDDQKRANEVIQKVKALKVWVDPYRKVVAQAENIKSLYKEAFALSDEAFCQELEGELAELKKGVEDLEIKKMLSQELDENNCYLSINAGAGGTESCDWALMLARMYRRWAEKRGWQVEEIDHLDGEVAGIKNVTFRLVGPFAYGYAKAEKGVHRLVRISPFDSNAKRHTSFASVEVTPELNDQIEIEIKPEEIRVDTYRSSGAGGQHVNTTDSAVRMTHLPTGTVVCCQNERSQIQNREMCLKMLKSKLYEKKLEEKREAMRKMQGEKQEISFGSQIRNYVFHPYTLVKDTRTKYEMGDIQAVMDGEIDGFVNAYLKEYGWVKD